VKYAGEILGKVETNLTDALQAINDLEKQIVKSKQFQGFKITVQNMGLTNKYGKLEYHKVTGLNFEFCRIV
jgi:hypothetical protein